ncbi:MAG TPA: penicillin-binding transpeptidase domain-containing protein [Actinomycetota bacterium]|nr:penicillin-binding transpeptidase domain-containing protein [Actinomycetota bacterium]
MLTESFRTPRGDEGVIKRILGPRSIRALLVGTIIVMFACTNEGVPPLPSAETAAADFLAAWENADFESVAEHLSQRSAAEWPAERLQRWWDRQVELGMITDVALEMTTEPVQPKRADDEDSPSYDPVEVGYAITYTSDAAREAVTLDGTFELAFEGNLEDDSERWTVAWEKELAWPGVNGGARFDVASKWPRRAAILDRQGRKLARGPAEERAYPFGSLAGSTIGHIATITKDTLDDAPEGREVGDLVGGSGLEAAFEERLAGTPTTTLGVANSAGEVVEEVGRAPGDPGEAVRVTLDVDVQRAAEQGYGNTVGGAAIIQPRSGNILALVDSSAFDPNFYVGAKELSPFNRALVGRYPPGSAMKVVTAAAALDSGKIKPSTQLEGPAEYKGVRNFESGAFGSIDFASALKFSVNTAFAQVAERLGAKRLTRYAEAFGFNRPGDMVLEHAESEYPEPQDLGDLMWSSIGQAQVLATPLQMASVAATVGNDGKRMEPRIDVSERKRGERVVTVKVADLLTSMMETVVSGGTGVNARIPGVSIAGKTGTAEVDVSGERMNHAWFIAFAPSGSPKVAVAVVAELGGVGGQVAAPLAKSILQNVLPVAP